MRSLSFQSGYLPALLCALATSSGFSIASAQTAATTSPGIAATKSAPAPAGPAVGEEPPPGSCMPIGVTVSGEIVFPFQCKDFIERQKAANAKPAAVEEKPAPVEAKPATEQQAAPAGEKSAAAADKQASTDETGAIAVNKPVPAEEKSVASDKAAPAEDKDAATDKPAPVEEKSAAVSDKPAAEEPTAVKPPEGNSKAAIEPDQPAPQPSSKRARPERRVHSAGPPACVHFRTYDAASQTYRDYSGQQRTCR